MEEEKPIGISYISEDIVRLIAVFLPPDTSPESITLLFCCCGHTVQQAWEAINSRSRNVAFLYNIECLSRIDVLTGCMQTTIVQQTKLVLRSHLTDQSSTIKIGLIYSRVLTCIRQSLSCVDPELTLLTCILHVNKTAAQTIKMLVICGYCMSVSSDTQQEFFECVLREFVKESEKEKNRLGKIVKKSEKEKNRLGKIALYLIQTCALTYRKNDQYYAQAIVTSCFSDRQLFDALRTLVCVY